MKRNLNQVLVTLAGKPIPVSAEPGSELLTLRTVSVNALLSSFDEERALPGAAKLERYQLATRINAADGDIELSAEEVALLKQLIGKAYTVLVVGQAYLALEAD